MNRMLLVRGLVALLLWGLIHSGHVIASDREPPPSLTESQRILWKIMDDIRHCDKSVPYEYDHSTRTVHPPELKKINGFRLKKLHRDIAIFEINETYEGLRARVLWMGRSTARFSYPVLSVAFREKYPTVRHRLERAWGVRFVDELRPGPDVIEDGSYAELTMTVEGKWRQLSVEEMPPDIYPHIALPDVGCNHVQN